MNIPELHLLSCKTPSAITGEGDANCALEKRNGIKQTYSIDLKDYYINENILNPVVFYYLLKLQHNILYSGPYSLTIIDHDVKIINLDETDSIILDINEYHLKKN